MSDEQQLDKELADLTDRLLAGDEVQPPDNLADLAQVVQQLHRTVRSGEQPDPAFKTRLAQRISQEWPLHTARQLRHSLPWYKTRMGQLSALAAGLAGVLVVVALLVAQDEDKPLSGTVTGSIPWAAGLVAVIGAGALLAWWWKRRH